VNLNRGRAFLKSEETPKQKPLHSITGYGFCIIFDSITKTGACNNGAGGSTERRVNLEVRLTTPQGKVKKS
jgi:hypothetical protein